MARKQRRANERKRKREERRKKKFNTALTPRQASDTATQVIYAVMLMAVKDVYGIDVHSQELRTRINEILHEFNTIGNKELSILMQVVKDEFKFKLKGL